MHVSQFNTSTCTLEAEDYGLPLMPNCPLLARKFGPGIADVVAALMQASHMLRDPMALP